MRSLIVYIGIFALLVTASAASLAGQKPQDGKKTTSSKKGKEGSGPVIMPHQGKSIPKTDIEIVRMSRMLLSSLRPGQSVRINAIVRNNGPLAISSSSLELKLIHTRWFTARGADGRVSVIKKRSQGESYSIPIPRMEPKEEKTIQYAVKIPSPLPPALSLVGRVDPQNYIKESNEQNNRKEMNFPVPLAKLKAEIRSVSPATLERGGRARVSYLIWNTGKASSPDQIRLELFLVPPPSQSGRPISLSSTVLDSIPRSDRPTSGAQSVSIPRNVSGTWKLRLVLDSTRRTPFDDFSDNQHEMAVTIR